MSNTEDSIFTKIINREIPATIQYEDEEFIAFDDIHPVAPIHVLIVPKKPFRTLEEVNLDNGHFHARLLQVARIVAQHLKISNNYKIFMNVGLKVQDVHHIHLHVYGGWQTAKTKDQINLETDHLLAQ